MIQNDYWEDEWDEEVELFEEVPLGRLTLKNRLIRSATLEGLADADGFIGDDVYARYKELAEGGSAAIITGFTGVTADDDCLDGMMRLCDDQVIPQYRKLTDLVHEQDCMIFAQLALGKYISEGKEKEVDELTAEDFEKICTLFADAADRAAQAGFDGVQLHMAHHFFLSRCHSPLFNHREDLYGGTSERRARILIDVLDAVKARVPELTVLCKINFSDEAGEEGLTLSDVLTAGMLLSEHGIDGMEVSAQGTSKKDIEVPYEEGYFKDYALSLKSVTEVPIILVGGIRTVASMEEILRNENTDFFSMSRPLIREPDLPNYWKENKEYRPMCISCNACFSTPGHRCTFKA